MTTSGTWGRRTRWRIPCPTGGWLLERLWAPRARDNGAGRSTSTPERVIAHMDPIPRAAEAFAAYNRRNAAESVNEAVENTTPHHGRAAHLNDNLQVIDFLGALMTINARTWQKHPNAHKPWLRMPPPAQEAGEPS